MISRSRQHNAEELMDGTGMLGRASDQQLSDQSGDERYSHEGGCP